MEPRKKYFLKRVKKRIGETILCGRNQKAHKVKSLPDAPRLPPNISTKSRASSSISYGHYSNHCDDNENINGGSNSGSGYYGAYFNDRDDDVFPPFQLDMENYSSVRIREQRRCYSEVVSSRRRDQDLGLNTSMPALQHGYASNEDINHSFSNRPKSTGAMWDSFPVIYEESDMWKSTNNRLDSSPPPPYAFGVYGDRYGSLDLKLHKYTGGRNNKSELWSNFSSELDHPPPYGYLSSSSSNLESPRYSSSTNNLGTPRYSSSTNNLGSPGHSSSTNNLGSPDYFDSLKRREKRLIKVESMPVIPFQLVDESVELHGYFDNEDENENEENIFSFSSADLAESRSLRVNNNSSNNNSNTNDRDNKDQINNNSSSSSKEVNPTFFNVNNIKSLAIRGIDSRESSLMYNTSEVSNNCTNSNRVTSRRDSRDSLLYNASDASNSHINSNNKNAMRQCGSLDSSLIYNTSDDEDSHAIFKNMESIFADDSSDCCDHCSLPDTATTTSFNSQCFVCNGSYKVAAAYKASGAVGNAERDYGSLKASGDKDEMDSSGLKASDDNYGEKDDGRSVCNSSDNSDLERFQWKESKCEVFEESIVEIKCIDEELSPNLLDLLETTIEDIHVKEEDTVPTAILLPTTKGKQKLGEVSTIAIRCTSISRFNGNAVQDSVYENTAASRNEMDSGNVNIDERYLRTENDGHEEEFIHDESESESVDEDVFDEIASSMEELYAATFDDATENFDKIAVELAETDEENTENFDEFLENIDRNGEHFKESVESVETLEESTTLKREKSFQTVTTLNTSPYNKYNRDLFDGYKTFHFTIDKFHRDDGIFCGMNVKSDLQVPLNNTDSSTKKWYSKVTFSPMTETDADDGNRKSQSETSTQISLTLASTLPDNNNNNNNTSSSNSDSDNNNSGIIININNNNNNNKNNNNNNNNKNEINKKNHWRDEPPSQYYSYFICDISKTRRKHFSSNAYISFANKTPTKNCSH